MNTFEIRRNIFNIYDNARILFNNYYNGISHDYTDEDVKAIISLLNMLETDIENVKEELK